MDITSEIPRYAALPRIPGLDLAYSWDFFGRGDELGTLNYLTPELIRSAAALVVDGTVISLNLPIDQPSPGLFGRERYVHEQFWVDRNTWDEKLDGYFPQSSTQWDGFKHFRAREHGFFGGRTGDPATEIHDIGIDVWARRGIVGRAVLLDVERYLQGRGSSVPVDERFIISAETLKLVAAAQGVTIERGDILVIRTGWPAKYSERPSGSGSLSMLPGLDADDETAQVLWDWHISALVTDLPAVEAVPGDPAVGSLHRRLLALLGLPLGELFDLEEVAVRCQDTGRYVFFFTSAPMHLPGGAGSPGNALAML
ncbi:cyclase family protein [Cryobacterium glaciale]|uniref:Cyclase family protein n=1 Tax=Cryobacterium glaciale TaxID=1259145 RepID=A0A4R8V4J3_9MICO|nr:cyclase family protein [Cryobacterium glaciale]TFB77308.1 cyclase family protein [Cryobacterium glaciale]